MANELKHGSVGTELTQAEWEAVGTHVVANQAIGDLIYASSTSQLRRLGISGTGTYILSISGGVPVWAAPAAAAAGSLTGSTLASGVTASSLTSVGTIATGVWQGTDVGVAYGGTGVSTLTDGGILLGSGASAITAMAVLTDGQMIVGNGSTDPVAESGATLRTSIGVGTGDKPEFDGLFINETAHGEVTNGLVINQGAATNIILALKASDVDTGLTTGTASQDVEVDDFLTIAKQSSIRGGIKVNILAESDVADPFFWEVYGGAPATSDTPGASAAIQFYCAKHDGSNGLQDMAADSNAFAVGEITSAGSRAIRLLLKADDGELHLGDTTLEALDDEDDRQIARALQMLGSDGGIIPSRWDNPLYDYDKLHALGLAGEKDSEGFNLFPLQSRLHVYAGGIWQNYIEIQELREDRQSMKDQISLLERQLKALEVS